MTVLTLPKIEDAKEPIKRTGGAGRPKQPNPYEQVLTDMEKGKTKQFVVPAADSKAHVNALRRAADALPTPVTVLVQVSDPNAKGQVAIRFETRDKIRRTAKPTETAPAATTGSK